MRRGRAAAPALVVALALALSVTGCGAPSAPAATGAARVVPADALAFIDVSLNRSDAAVAAVRSTVAALPGYRRVVQGLKARLSTITGIPFASGIRPWLGSELALAFVPDGASASELIVLGVGDPRLARRFVTRVRGAAARLIDGYVVVGESAAVAAAGRGPALATTAGFRAARAAAPAARVLDAYASGTGLTELLSGHTGLAGVATAVLSAEAPTTVAVALAPTGDGLMAWVRLTRPRGSPAPTPFTPTLAGRLPADTAWVAQVPSLTASAPGLLAALAGGSGSPAAGGLTGRLVTALKAQGVALAPLAALFGHESAIFGLDGGLGVITRTGDPRAARLELGAAGQALAELFSPSAGGGIEPVVATRAIDGVQVTQYRQGPSAQLDAAVFGGDVVLTDSPAAMTAIIDRKAPLSGSALYRSVLAGSGPSAGPVLFGAINRLVRRGRSTGLLESLGLQGATPALAQVSAAGLTSTGGRTETTAELFFTIS